MPLEFAAEMALRFVFDVVIYTLGYCTGWLLIPVLSFGYYSVEMLPPPKKGARRHRPAAGAVPRQLSAEATARIGILFWVLLAALAAFVGWLSKI